MYRLIIADDENLILNGLCECIDWDSLGFDVVNRFNDGKPVINYIKENSVDVILTDIKMSNVTGLEIAQFVHENSPETKVILLSGYQEFELAQKSIEYGVELYLLKPINFTEIKSVFSRLKIELDKKKAIVEQNNSSHQELLNLAKTSWLQDLYYGVPLDEKQVSVLFSGAASEDLLFAVVNLEIVNYSDFISSVWKYGREALITSILNFMQLDSSYEFFNISGKNGKELFLGVIRDKALTNEKFTEYIKTVCQNMSEILSIGVNLKEASLFYTAEDFANNQFKFIFDENSSPNAGNLNEFDEFSKLILTNLNTSNFDTGKKLTESLLMKLSHCPVWLTRAFATELISSIRRTFLEINPDATLNFIRCLHKINHSNNTKDMSAAICEYIEEFVKFAPQNTANQEMSLIQKAKSYIELNYNKDISLDILADVLYINKSYLCRVFKEKAGVNFTDFLISLRIQKATDLIDMGVPLNEVCGKVGYNDSRYFSRLFKNKTGLTPLEYKKNNEGRNLK